MLAFSQNELCSRADLVIKNEHIDIQLFENMTLFSSLLISIHNMHAININNSLMFNK